MQQAQDTHIQSTDSPSHSATHSHIEKHMHFSLLTFRRKWSTLSLCRSAEQWHQSQPAERGRETEAHRRG